MKKIVGATSALVVVLELLAPAAQARPRPHERTSFILAVINETGRDRWSQGESPEEVAFDRLWCDRRSCVLSYLARETGSSLLERGTCRLTHVKRAQDALQPDDVTTTLSSELLQDVDACLP
ncbi:MAG TPA: hypothetical protein VK446_10070 [Methylocystis sp.]|nr:hypothetical protein [Methylocystis sp.]